MQTLAFSMNRGGARLRRALTDSCGWEIRARRSLAPPFMVPMRDGKTVEAFHEPFPLIPSFSPSGGEGARRAVEGDSDRFMASIHVRILEVSPSHEPPLSRPSATLSPPCGERAGRGVPIWFLVPMRAQKRKETSHELLRVVDPRS